VEPPDIVLHDGDETIPCVPAIDPRQGLERAPQGGQRVLQFVCDICRKALNRIEAIVERLSHLPQSSREMADLVGAGGEIRNLLARADSAPDTLSRIGETAD